MCSSNSRSAVHMVHLGNITHYCAVSDAIPLHLSILKYHFKAQGIIHSGCITMQPCSITQPLINHFFTHYHTAMYNL